MNNNIYLCIRKKDEIIIDERIKFPDFIKREESKKAYTLLKYIMEYLELDFNINDIKISEYGKPYLKSDVINFNYSHSKKYIAISVSIDKVGIDIEDEFKISEEAINLYLNNIKDNLRYNWVLKEAYFKLKENFSDKEFRELNPNKINCNKYVIDTELYTCICTYKNNKKIIIL